MSAQAVEGLLARLLADAALRREFLHDPAAIARDAGLEAAEIEAFVNIDRPGLEMAAASYAAKRSSTGASKTSR